MSRPLRTSFAWLWIATLLTATVGVNVQRIYCYCVGKADVGIFHVVDACQVAAAEAAATCCSSVKAVKQEYDCCEGADSCDAIADPQGCTQRTIQFVHLDVKYLVDKPFEKNFDFPAWVAEMPIFHRVVRRMLCQVPREPQPPAPSPPPPYGRALCVRQQIFRL